MLRQGTPLSFINVEAGEHHVPCDERLYRPVSWRATHAFQISGLATEIRAPSKPRLLRLGWESTRIRIATEGKMNGGVQSTLHRVRTVIAWCSATAIFVACGSLTAQAPMAVERPEADKPALAAKVTVPQAIELLKSGDDSGTWLEMIARAKAQEAVPVLEERFASSEDRATKAHIASVLVRLGEADGTYWDYLTRFATEAIESDAPEVEQYDQDGKPSNDPSPAFVSWAKANHIRLEAAEDDSMRLYPAAVAFLGMTGDPRSAPLLRRGLLSPNYRVEWLAARGLAQAKDSDSVSLIIAASNRATPAWQGMIARSLVYFDDPDAQRAVDQYVPKDVAKDLRAERASGKTPFF
jgi:hypothetical protein